MQVHVKVYLGLKKLLVLVTPLSGAIPYYEVHCDGDWKFLILGITELVSAIIWSIVHLRR